jgi:hypothetical protein
MKYGGLIVCALLVAGCGSGAGPRSATGGAGVEDGTGGSTGGQSGSTGGKSGGTGGQGGSSGTGGSEVDSAAASPVDAGASLDTSSSDVAAAPEAAVADAPPALAACPKPSVDHLEIWTAHGGSLRPAAGGNLLIKEGERHYMKVEFLPGGQWHEIVVPVANSLSKKIDLTTSKGFTITYSATADLWVQLRPLSHAHGGEQHTAKLPSTGGMMQELFVPFAPESWGMLLGDPTFPFAQALRDANFFDFVGPPASANTFVVRGLRFDGYVPPCS